MKLMCDLQAETLNGYSETSTESGYKRMPLISSRKPACVQKQTLQGEDWKVTWSVGTRVMFDNKGTFTYRTAELWLAYEP
jgi:hypothetical protein